MKGPADAQRRSTLATDLHFLTIAEAASLIERRQLSPVALTRAFLDRIAAIDPQLNAYLLVTAEQALDQARIAEAEIMAGNYRGPMHGIPFALKDIYCTAGIRTRARPSGRRTSITTSRSLAQRANCMPCTNRCCVSALATSARGFSAERWVRC